MIHRAGRACAILAIVLPVLTVACVSVDATKPLVPSTLSAALNDVAHPALDLASSWFSGTNVVALPVVPTRCPFESSSQFFVCSPLSGGGLTLNQRFTLLDASGGKQSAFGETTTSLHLENAVAGTHAEDIYAITVDGQQVLDLTGLGTARHTLNGSSLTLTSIVYPANDAWRMTSERKTSITDLVFPVVAAGAPTAWPVSGTVDMRSRSINAKGDTSVFIATMRFDGSSLVSLTVTIPGGLQTCRVNITMLPPGAIGCMGSPDPPVGRDALPRATPVFR